MTDKELTLSILRCKPINYRADFAKICESVPAGVMLSQAYYWDGKSTKHGDGWFEKTTDEWEQETALSAKQQQTARHILETRGFMDSARKGDRGKMCSRVNHENVHAALIKLYSAADQHNGESVQIGKKDNLHRQNGVSKIGKKANLSLQRVLTENTPENTTAPIGDGSTVKKRKHTYPSKEMADIFEKGYPALHAQNKFPWGKESGKWGKAFQRIWEQSGESMEKVKSMAADLFRRIKNAKPTDLYWKEAGFTPTTLSGRWHQLQPVKAVEEIAQPFPNYQNMTRAELETAFHDWSAKWDIMTLKKNISPDSFSRYVNEHGQWAPAIVDVLERENQERNQKQIA